MSDGSAPGADGSVSGAALRLTLVDPAGHNGFPGTVVTEVLYEVTPDSALRIDYRATTDAPTVLNLTNHTYFNLAGEGSGSCHDQLLAINAEVVQPVDPKRQIPVGFCVRGRHPVRLPGDEADRARHRSAWGSAAASSSRSPVATTTTGC